MKKIYIIALLSLLLSCSVRMDREAQMITESLTLEEKIGQLLMFAVPGQSINKENRMLIEKYLPGGIILFGFNVSEEDNLPVFIQELQGIAIDKYAIPMFVSTDQEGGRVIRIKRGVTPFPGNLAAGISGNYKDIEKMAAVTGMELRKIGVNMNLAPVLDVNNNPSNPVINSRSFGSDPHVVAKAGAAYIKGLQGSGCIAVGKHFPGHGDTEADSHHVLPVISHDMSRLREVELRPFAEAVKNKVEGIMSAHIHYPAIIDDDKPATLSDYFMTKLLREEMKFKGIVMTDDLEMNAVAGKMDLGSAALESFLAGSDIILVSTYGKNIPVIYEALLNAAREGIISSERLDDSVSRIIELKLRYNVAGYNKEEGRIYQSDFQYSEKSKKILEQAESINSSISRGAIYYSGTGDLYKKKKDEKRIYVSSNRSFRENLSLRQGDRLIYSADEIKSGSGEKNLEHTTVVLQTYRINRSYAENLNRRIKRSGGNFMILYSGNPFDLAGWNSDIPVLFTFSFTDESMKQAASVLNGEFSPLLKINCKTGFRD